jgi:hypothetical protein
LSSRRRSGVNFGQGEGGLFHELLVIALHSAVALVKDEHIAEMSDMA